MQRLDHATVRRMIADREADAAHARLTRSLSRAKPRAAGRLPEHVHAVRAYGLERLVSALRMGRGVREDRRPPAVASLGTTRRPAAAPIGCV